MSRGGRLLMLAVGAVAISVAAFPAPAQIVVGDSQSSVDVNWDVLDRLGPEPSLPGLMNREVHATYASPAPAAMPVPRPVARPAAPPARHPAQTSARKPKPLAKAKEAPAPKPVQQASKPRPAAPLAATALVSPPPAPAPDRTELPKVDLPKAVAGGKTPEPVKAVAEAKPEAPKVDLPKAVEVVKTPEPVKSVAETKVEAPKVEVPKVAEAPKPTEPAKLVAAAKPDPVKPEPPKADIPKVEPPTIVEPVKPEPVKTIAPPKAELPPPPTVLAAVPSAPPPPMAAAAPLRKGDSLTIPFGTDSSRLSESSRSELERMAHRMERDETLSLQLLAYAAGDEANASKARRLSLSRALEVRKYLMEMGVRSTRIEVRALGNKVEEGAPDRVDAVLARR